MTRAPGSVAAAASAAFQEVHGRAATGVWSAPGRVNLIGEHTDYNDGFVLPFALPHRTATAAAPRTDGVLTMASQGSDGRIQRAEPVRVDTLRPGEPDGWQAYPAGVAWVLRELGTHPAISGGADIVITGDVPTGAGLSSSAALECATALALLGVAGQEPADQATRARIACWAQRAENEFVGIPTGLLDQTASMCCTAGHALFFDVRTGELEQVPFDADRAGLRVLVIDTRVKHAHGESGYADRRRGTERAADLLGVKALRDVGPADLPAALATLPAELGPLARHVVTENERVVEVVRLLREGRLADIGPLLDASHASMRDDYRISCPELDLAVQSALDAGALGARMTGGGFGGSAIALVTERDLATVETAVESAFAGAGYRSPRSFVAVPAAGAHRDQ